MLKKSQEEVALWLSKQMPSDMGLRRVSKLVIFLMEHILISVPRFHSFVHRNAGLRLLMIQLCDVAHIVGRGHRTGSRLSALSRCLLLESTS